MPPPLPRTHPAICLSLAIVPHLFTHLVFDRQIRVQLDELPHRLVDHEGSGKTEHWACVGGKVCVCVCVWGGGPEWRRVCRGKGVLVEHGEKKVDADAHFCTISDSAAGSTADFTVHVYCTASHTFIVHTWRVQVVGPRRDEGAVSAVDLEHRGEAVEQPDADGQPALTARQRIPLQGNCVHLRGGGGRRESDADRQPALTARQRIPLQGNCVHLRGGGEGGGRVRV